MSASRFNIVLLEISNQLTADQLNSLKFLYRDVVGKREQEKITSGLQLFQALTERGELRHDNTERLSELLGEINRRDLSERLNGVQNLSVCAIAEQDETERAKLDIATGVIAENLGRTWRKLGRKLGLTDVKLDSIFQRHPTDLEETVIELLKEWRRSCGASPRTENLIEALRACQYNLTADKVEDKLASLGY